MWTGLDDQNHFEGLKHRKKRTQGDRAVRRASFGLGAKFGANESFFGVKRVLRAERPELCPSEEGERGRGQGGP